MSNKQTSIEYLWEQLKMRGYLGELPPYLLFDQAKAMHKEEIMEAQSIAISKADMTNNRGYFDCEQYYTDTYGKE